MGLGERLVRGLRLIEPKDRLVKVKRWRPAYIEGELLWPLMLIDRNGCTRTSVWPIWDKNRIRDMLRLAS